jgi:hypothetical protein
MSSWLSRRVAQSHRVNLPRVEERERFPPAVLASSPVCARLVLACWVFGLRDTGQARSPGWADANLNQVSGTRPAHPSRAPSLGPLGPLGLPYYSKATQEVKVLMVTSSMWKVPVSHPSGPLE